MYLKYFISRYSIKIFSPDEILRILWDFFYVFFIFYLVILIPFQYFFQLKESDYHFIFHYISKTTTWIYILDIIINLNSGYYSRGLIIKGRKKIIKLYFKKFFILDCLGFAPLLLNSSNLFQLLFIFLLIKLKTLANKLDQILLLKDKFKGNIIFKLLN